MSFITVSSTYPAPLALSRGSSKGRGDRQAAVRGHQVPFRSSFLHKQLARGLAIKHIGKPTIAEAAGGGSGSGGVGSSDGGGGGGSDGSGRPYGLAIGLSYLFAVLVAAGGTVGYLKRGSTESAYTSAIVAALLVLAAALLQSPNNKGIGAGVGLGTSAGLGWLMYPRYSKSKKFMPAGMLTGASAAMAIMYIICIV